MFRSSDGIRGVGSILRPGNDQRSVGAFVRALLTGDDGQARHAASSDGATARPFNLLRWFTISSLVAIAAISVVAGTVLSEFLTRHMLERDSVVTSDFVRGVVSEANRKHALEPYHTNVSAMDHLLRGDPHQTTRQLREFFTLIAGMPDVFHFNLYNEKYMIVWSSRPDLIGAHLGPNEELKKALTGKTVIELVRATDGGEKKVEHAVLSSAGNPFVENYIPIWNESGSRIVAVAEIYKSPTGLFDAIELGRRFVWIGAVLSGLILFLAVFWIARRADRIIRDQREQLRTRSQMSSNRIAEINERFLRRIGADLHDGPTQLISFALLRLDALRSALKRQFPDKQEAEEIESVRNALYEAMREIRELSAGLTLAKLEEMTPFTVLREIIGAHERRTDTTVSLTIEAIPKDLPLPLKISVFRFVQEALNNAYRHGDGIDQRVTSRFDGRCLTLEVADSGPGFDPKTICQKQDSGLGLIGLRDRIESLGATLDIKSRPGAGTRLTMRCAVQSDSAEPCDYRQAS